MKSRAVAPGSRRTYAVASSGRRAMLRSRSTVSAWVANTCWRRTPMRSISLSTKRSGRRFSNAPEAAPVQAQERLRAVAPLGGELRALQRGRHRRGQVELAPPGQLGEPRHVHGVDLDRRAREGAHGRAGVGGVGQHPQPGEHVAHLGALEVRRRAR